MRRHLRHQRRRHRRVPARQERISSKIHIAVQAMQTGYIVLRYMLKPATWSGPLWYRLGSHKIKMFGF